MALLYQLEDQMDRNLKKLNNQGPLGRVKKQSLLRALIKNQNADSTQNQDQFLGFGCESAIDFHYQTG